ncbi:MAG: Gfo/Idh/MocA family oxidoreductase [Pirellulaceae bacterium]|jgi:predicted dehydrogenase|nr:Gfo/Idh/MocA family oxidoreductase [Pirellulaceae bacterium]
MSADSRRTASDRKISRRTVLRSAAAASTAFSLFTISGTKASGRVIGANDTVRIGVAGINGRGGAHISAFTDKAIPNVQLTYLIDVDSSLFDSRTKTVENRIGSRPTCVQDVRQALDDKTLDAISIATPNHWHSLMTIWACQAGKDVYVEKPISHNVFEGRKCVEAAKKYNRVVQHGTQSRSDNRWARETAAAHSGKYGQLVVSKGSASKPGSGRNSIGFKEAESPPSSLDFNLWLGPAKEQPYHKNIVHYNWHWFWETGNGEIGNQGVHQMDIARWGIKDGTLPTKVFSVGGRFLPDGPDQAETPNMQLAVMEFGPATLVFEVRGLVGDKKRPEWPSDVSNAFFTTEGVIKESKFFPKDGSKAVPLEIEFDPPAPGGAFGSFINAMRTRKPEDCNCDAEVAHYSAACCHLPNISYRLGTQGTYDKARGAIGDNTEAVAVLERIRDNSKAVGIPVDKTVYTIGPTLTFDPASERFVGERSEEANKLITREYRAPFIVPETV